MGAIDRQFGETPDERNMRLRTKRKAQQRCFKKCSAGEFLDPENGCVSVCKSWERCVGWRALLAALSTETEE